MSGASRRHGDLTARPDRRRGRGEKERSARAGFSGLSRLWYRTDLLHHAEHVHLDPALHDLALDYPVYGMTYELDPLAGRSYSLELAQVRAQKYEPVGHLLPFGDLLHVGAGVIREGSTYLGHVPLELLGKLGSHEIIQRVQVAFANRLRDPVG